MKVVNDLFLSPNKGNISILALYVMKKMAAVNTSIVHFEYLKSSFSTSFGTKLKLEDFPHRISFQ